MKNETAYSYLRFSKAEQGKGDSIRRQTAQTEELCTRNGWVLDSTLTDRGLSAWSGKNAKQGALSVFLAGVESGKIATPCVLVVEQLDRITRQAPLDAASLLTKLLNAGVSIAVFRPSERIYTRKNAKETGVFIEIAFTLCLAFDESEKKSERLKYAWAAKRQNTSKVLTSKVPKWLTVVDGKIIPIPEKVKVIKRIVTMSIEGHGDGMIAKILNREKVPTLSGKGTWHGASINSGILRNRGLIGEYQPNRLQGKDRIPDGPPRIGYYPAIVSESEFARMQSAIDNRKLKRGRVGKTCANLFQGIIKDAETGWPMVLKKLGGGANRTYWSMLINSVQERSKLGSCLRFPYQLFEDAVMKFFGRLMATGMIGPSVDHNATHAKLEALQGRLADIDARLEIFRKRLLTDKGFETLLSAIKALEEEKKSLLADLQRAKQAAHQPTGVDLLSEAFQLRNRLHTVQGDDLLALRLKLRAVIRSLVEKIETTIVVDELEGKDARKLTAKIHFRNGSTQTIVALHQRFARNENMIGYFNSKGTIIWSTVGKYDEQAELRTLKRAHMLQALAARKRT